MIQFTPNKKTISKLRNLFSRLNSPPRTPNNGESGGRLQSTIWDIENNIKRDFCGDARPFRHNNESKL